MNDGIVLAFFDPVTLIIQFLIYFAISMAIQELTRKKQDKLPDAAPGAVEMPTVLEGRSFGVVFGTPKMIKDSVIAWWGDVKTEEIWDHYHKPSGPFNTKKVWYVTGYRYAIGIHAIPCIGPVDGIKQFRYGEAPAWPNGADKTEVAADGLTTATIYKGDVLGQGNDGVYGEIDILYGTATQAINSYLATELGTSNISANRGLVSVIFKQVWIGEAPYPKAWGFIVKRTQVLTDGSAQWYIAKADIDGDMNPAHMIRECYTNTQWGLGHSTSLFNEAAWQAVADVLYTEGMGVSRYWVSSNEQLEDVIKDILVTIDATFYQDPSTGLFVLKLIRDDYVAGNLEEFSNADILKLTDYTRPSLGDLPNAFYIKYSDVYDDTPASLADHDLALQAQQGGGYVPITFEYYSITKAALAGKILARERYQMTSMVPTMKVVCKRTMAHLLPGDVFKLSWPDLGIVQQIVRVMPDAKYGTLKNPQVEFVLMEDVYSAQDSLYSVPGRSPYTDWDDAAPAESMLIEAPFWTILGRHGLSLTLQLDDEAGFVMVGAWQPTDGTIDYELMLRNNTGLDLESKGAMAFTPVALITEALPLNAVDTIVTLDVDVSGLTTGSYAVVGDEIVKIEVAEDSARTQVVTLKRGCLDTVPAAHIAGSEIWFMDAVSYLGDEITDGYIPGAKILTRTSTGRLAEADATLEESAVFDSRIDRPYPPGNVKINSISYPANFSGQPTITWSHRDRTEQTDYIVEHSEGNIGPETNVTYTLIIYGVNEDSGGTQTALLRTVTGLTGTTYTYSEANERSDSGLGPSDPLNESLRFVLYSIRT